MREISSRREFLKTSGVVAGAAAAATAPLSLARSAHAAGSDVLTFALVGCGGRGTGAIRDFINAAQLLNQPVKLIAMADAFEDRVRGSLNRLQDEWSDYIDVPDERICTGLDNNAKVLETDPDVVLMASPPGFRPWQYGEAVRAGKHVFMEKPCCIDAPGYRSLVASNEMADEKELRVVVGLQRHHQASYIRGIEEIHEGKLGDVMFLRVYWNGLGGGGRDLGSRPQNDPEEMRFQVRNWGCFRWLYGDNIVEQHVHNIDIANWVMARDGNHRAAHPVEANGMGGRVHRGNYGDIFDHHYIEFTYADGTKMFSQSRHQPGTWNQVNEFVHGKEGSRSVSVGGGPELESGNPYVQEQVALIKAIRDGEELNEGWFGAVSSMTAVMGRMASYSGQVIRWDEAVAQGPEEGPEQLAWDAQPRSLPDQDGRYPYPTPGAYNPYESL